MERSAKNILLFSIVFFSPFTKADLPLTVEELITQKGNMRFDLSLSYANRDKEDLSLSEPIVIQTGSNSFVTIPTKIGEVKSNYDVLVGTLGLRYGVTRDTEIYTRTSYMDSSARYSMGSQKSSDGDSHLLDAWVGVNHQFSYDNDTPAVLGFFEAAVYEKHQHENASLKSWGAGLTVYRAIDPVVLSTTFAYRWNQERQDGYLNYKPGNHFLVVPSIAFAVNDRVTLTGGFQWMNRQPDRYEGESSAYRHTTTDLTFGLGYGISKGNILNTTLKVNASGNNGADLRLNWLYAF
ncbi:hypothetical protein [Marinobacterium stanieri]|uniref:hypothetical protein n=1 Tax=Marinobacterium stanieri TaxID=49186 RepID=UPI0003064AD0|nr:hypothetical protein [Marinobacterium stanieri]